MNSILVNSKSTIELLKKEFPDRNQFALPRLLKITVSSGVGRAKDNQKQFEATIQALTVITGQKPVVTKARQAISGFKLRQGDIVGVQVTLRGQKMWDFLNRLVAIVLPRIRDFRGLNIKAIDKTGNYSLGIREHSVFPEIEEDKIIDMLSLGIAFTTSAKNRNDGEILLRALGLPLERKS